MRMGSRWDVVEEKTFYPDWWVASAEQIGNHLRESFADVDLRITIRGGQAMLAYYTDGSVAVEQHGLTDAYIARNWPSIGVRAGHRRRVSLLPPDLSER